MQKFKVKILSTAPLSNELIKQAALKNIMIEQISFIEIKFIEDKNVSDIIDKYLQQKVTVVFTSMNAVNAVAKHLKQKPVWKIFCIGNATKSLVARLFGKEKIAGTAFNAADLAEVISNNEIENAVFFCGDQRRDELPGKLKQHNINLNEVIVYKTIATPKFMNFKYDGIMFFSPSAVDSFFSVNDINEETQLFAIGSTTVEAIKQYNKNNVVTSALPAKEILVKQVMEFYKEER